MRIGIEACTWTNKRGYGRFIRQLVTAMVRGFPEHHFTLVMDAATADEGEFPEAASLEVVRTREQQIKAASADGSRRLGDLWRLGRVVSKRRFDVFFFPTRYSYYPVFGSTPLVVAFHDATAESHPELIFPGARSRWFWRLKSRLALFQADRLVTVSEAARRQIAAAFSYAPERISVITEGPDAVFRKLDGAEATAGVRERYALAPAEPLILYVGGISPHKNLSGLFRSLATLPGAWHAVLVGDYEGDSFWGCHAELVQLAAELGLTERITFTGYVPDDQLVKLYNTATLLVLPSVSEGFGLPVVEAMACGLPVAASARSSLPEVLGDAGLLFDPLITSEITAALSTILGNEALRETLRARGLERSRQYTWELAAQRMVTILEAVARR